MLNDMVQESPLIGLSSRLAKTLKQTSKAFSFSERPFTTLVNLRGDAESAAFVQAVEKALRITLPTSQSVSSENAGLTITWLGPDEWLIQSTDISSTALEAVIRKEMQDMVYSIVDVSSGYTVFELAGTRVRDVLAKGCPLDLHPRVFALGQSAQSHYFKSAILVRNTGQNQFELIVRRSFAEYCCHMILDAAEEYMQKA